MTRKPRSEAGEKSLHPKGTAKREGMKPKATASPAEPVDNRRPNGQFGRGNRANPGGRPKENSEVRELAREYTVRAIERLAEVMEQHMDLGAAVRASNVLLDRGWGKAPQSMELTGKDGAPLVPVLNLVHTDGRGGQP